MTELKKISLTVLSFLLIVSAFLNHSCKVQYGFKDVNFPDSIKTVKINFIENNARYQSPQLSPKLTDKLRQKIISQTKLIQSKNENPDWEISGFITDYSFSTSGISGQQVSTNQLTVSVHITLNSRKEDKIEDHDVSRSFEFKGNLSFQQAETALLDEIVRTLTDEIFNKLFSKW